ARVARRAPTLAAGLRPGGVTLGDETLFATVSAVDAGRAPEVAAAGERAGINRRLVDADRVGIACDELTTPAHLRIVWDAFGVAGAAQAQPGLPERLRRDDAYLTHPVFHAHRPETAMLR